MKPKDIPGVPKHTKGSFHDTESTKMINSSKELELKFNILKQRFFNINEWQKYCTDVLADFKLCDQSGKIVERLPEIGDYIRIDIPGPGGCEGDSYDWVQIIMMETAIPHFVMIQCRPSPKPFKSSGKVAHFYSQQGTSTFTISKGDNFLKTGIYGRNEFTNKSAGFFDYLRNLVISIGGMFGFSKIQWKCLADGLLDFE